jgi:large subunit ribosomal protein L40
MSRPTLARVSNALPSASSSSSVSASCSRCFYATTSSGYKPTKTSGYKPNPSDSRTDLFRSILYPPGGYAPRSSAPVGAHHPDHLARLSTVLPNSEVYETIERAYKLHRRHKREARHAALKVKYKAMVEACDVLSEITMPEKGPDGAALPKYDRKIYIEAIKRPDPHAKPKPTGRHIAPLEIWQEARIEGFMPRELWIPYETRGAGWNYGWKRPSASIE